uniref:Putative ovule protein n=1 Tax=Solanum chacoense TaxID=4108 RepID=A0A0V0H5E7_SOLCH
MIFEIYCFSLSRKNLEYLSVMLTRPIHPKEQALFAVEALSPVKEAFLSIQRRNFVSYGLANRVSICCYFCISP